MVVWWSDIPAAPDVPARQDAYCTVIVRSAKQLFAGQMYPAGQFEEIAERDDLAECSKVGAPGQDRGVVPFELEALAGRQRVTNCIPVPDPFMASCHELLEVLGHGSWIW
jgi:hypothetical protein